MKFYSKRFDKILEYLLALALTPGRSSISGEVVIVVLVVGLLVVVVLILVVGLVVVVVVIVILVIGLIVVVVLVLVVEVLNLLVGQHMIGSWPLYPHVDGMIPASKS